MSAPVRLGLLHTVPVLAATFDRLAGELGTDVELVHVVDASLLARAVADGGVRGEVTDRTVAHARYLAGLGVDAVLVTCSSIGECADVAGRGSEVPVLRVDRPMARRAVALASAAGARRRVAVLATLISTLGPTERLLQAEVVAAGETVELAVVLVEGAAAARGRGDQAEHDELVRSAVERARRSSDVVVLAQASMVDSLAGAPDLPVPVLSSPSSALAAAVAAARHED